MNIPNDTLENWLSEPKQYQKSSLEKLIAEFGEEEAAKRWLSSYGPSNIVHFGGEKNNTPFFDRFNDEFRKFICGDESYKKEREQLLVETSIA